MQIGRYCGNIVRRNSFQQEAFLLFVNATDDPGPEPQENST